MGWKHLTIDDLRQLLSEDETKQLNEYSLDGSMSAVIDGTIDLVADTWRGAFYAKGYSVDTREHYIPSSYAYYVLVHARHAVWTRFPNSQEIALDDRRAEEYEKAMELLKDPYIGTDEPDPDHDPSKKTEGKGSGSGSIIVPAHRFDQWYLANTAQTLQLSNYF